MYAQPYLYFSPILPPFPKAACHFTVWHLAFFHLSEYSAERSISARQKFSLFLFAVQHFGSICVVPLKILKKSLKVRTVTPSRIQLANSSLSIANFPFLDHLPMPLTSYLLSPYRCDVLKVQKLALIIGPGKL